MEQAWAAGLAVVVSAGNDAGAVSKPGDDPFVITVGAADVHGTASLADDTVAAFSSAVPGKPDLVAPGVSLGRCAPRDRPSTCFNETARVGDAYFKGSGTSQAAAVVSGVIARMFDADPALTPDQIEGGADRTANGALTGPGRRRRPDRRRRPVGTNPSKRGRARVMPRANRIRVASTGLGSIAPAAARSRWSPTSTATACPSPSPARWTCSAIRGTPPPLPPRPGRRRAFAASPWTPLTTELTAAATLPAAAAPPRVAWEARHWGATDWVSAGWDAQAWAARHWGARHWGAFGWQ